MKITIGWTKHSAETKAEFDYAPFWDPFKPGMPQHTETIEVDYNTDNPEVVANLVFAASNQLGAFGHAPYGDGEPTIIEKLMMAIEDTGYRGREAHFSLSIGDTVTVHDAGAPGDITLACTREGWEEVELQVTPTVTGLPREWRKLANQTGRDEVRDAYRNAADELEVATPSYGQVWHTIQTVADFLDDETTDKITDAVMNAFGGDPVNGRKYES